MRAGLTPHAPCHLLFVPPPVLFVLCAICVAGDSIETDTLVSPFLEVIWSGVATGTIASVALNSLHKFISYNFISECRFQEGRRKGAAAARSEQKEEERGSEAHHMYKHA